MTEAAAPARRIALLVNPAAGRHDPWALARLAGMLARDGASVETLTSRAPGDLAARVADLDVDTVAVAGGDGTVNEVVGGLAARRDRPLPRLVVVPQGTADVLAHEYGLPRSAQAIAAAVAAGRTRPLHLGTVAGGDGAARPFFLMASAGFDAEVVAAVEARHFKPLKKLAFVLSALRLAIHRRAPFEVTLWAPGATEPRHVTCATAIVTKARHYGGPFVLTRETGCDRAGLHFVGLIDDRPAALAAAVLKIARGALEGAANVVSGPVARVRIDGAGAVQIDGEPAGHTPIDVAVEEMVLDLVIAADRDATPQS
ncbi:diacylglycerol kinase family lipid kinase [Siculibacillus lacustris]|uniref:Diacylglycerol kinase family lipid kinase n=1 Tax=Siculibacillus lacustris TaxID=1549641 RepID=A0A4Q9VKE1_9HYPH|nr:diacylglycerol kinase family protein [Siculibacillus lacustris]TBW34962.1 diacylglycerol kinase family lipid kinase [Siculibacillus lacustris]